MSPSSVAEQKGSTSERQIHCQGRKTLQVQRVTRKMSLYWMFPRLANELSG